MTSTASTTTASSATSAISIPTVIVQMMMLWWGLVRMIVTRDSFEYGHNIWLILCHTLYHVIHFIVTIIHLRSFRVRMTTIFHSPFCRRIVESRRGRL